MRALQILQHARVDDCRTTVSKTFSDYAAVQVLLGGEIILERDGAPTTLEAPCIWFTYDGPHFRYYPTEGSIWSHRFLSFRGALVEEWISEGLLFMEPYVCDADTLKWIERELDVIIEEHEKIERFSQALSHNLLERFLLKLAMRRYSSRESDSLRAHLLSYLERENFRPNGYGPLAEELNVGESTLRRRFREEVGIPIHQFTERERVRQCKQLLKETDHSLEEIAMKMQYPDVYYFSRHFTKVAGLRPGAYRRAELFT